MENKIDTRFLNKISKASDKFNKKYVNKYYVAYFINYENSQVSFIEIFIHDLIEKKFYKGYIIDKKVSIKDLISDFETVLIGSDENE